MRLYFDNGRVIWLARRHDGGVAVQQGRNRLLLNRQEVAAFLDAVHGLIEDPISP